MKLILKILGWILLVFGIGLIGWTLLSSYNIFTAKTSVPEFFEMPKAEVKIQVENSGIENIQSQLQNLLQEQLKGVIPDGSIPKLLNLTVWSLLAFILIFGGTQIAGLGIKLIQI